jgi:hypothetical protein
MGAGPDVVEDCFSEVGEAVETIMWWRACCMIKRKQDEGEGERSAPTSYLGLQMADPGFGRFGVRPLITGATEVAAALPAGGPWHDPVGQEPPLGFSVDEVPPNCGGAGGTIAIGENNGSVAPLRDREDAASISGRTGGDADGG